MGDLFAPSAPLYDTIETTPHDYILCDTPEKIASAVEELMGAERLCFDTETTGLDYHTDKVVGVGLSATAHRAFYVPTTVSGALEMLRPLLESESIEKVGQNIKFDLQMLRHEGISVGGTLWDTMIMHYLLDPDGRHGMNHLAQTLLGYSPIEIESLIGRGTKQLTMDRVAVELVAPLLCRGRRCNPETFPGAVGAIGALGRPGTLPPH